MFDLPNDLRFGLSQGGGTRFFVLLASHVAEQMTDDRNRIELAFDTEQFVAALSRRLSPSDVKPLLVDRDFLAALILHFRRIADASRPGVRARVRVDFAGCFQSKMPSVGIGH